MYLPPEESRARAAGMLYENRPTEGVDWRERLTAFVAETDRVFDLLDGVMPEIAWLDDSQTLTYLHATISTRRYRVGVPEVPFHIDALLTDSALVGGLAPMLGDQHLRVVSVRGFPTSTWPGILDDLNRLGFAYRWSTRFLCLDKAEAERELGRLRRQWFAKRKNVIALLRETIFQQESPLVDTDASNKAADADAALQELGSDQVAFGYLTATVTVLDADPAVADEKLRMVERVIQGRGFVTIPDQMLRDAQERWKNTLNGLHTAMRMQAQVSQNLAQDESALADLVSQSQSATGALQAMQATNQLLALQAKQSIQAQQLQITQDRAASLELARQAAATERAREVRRRFLGTGTPYTPQSVNFYNN